MSDGIEFHSMAHDRGSWLHYVWFSIKIRLGLWPSRDSLVKGEISILDDRRKLPGLKMYARGTQLLDKDG